MRYVHFAKKYILLEELFTSVIVIPNGKQSIETMFSKLVPRVLL